MSRGAITLPVVLAAACALAQTGTALAQAGGYPARGVRLIVPFAPGGGTDIVARAIAARLSELWGQQVMVDNRPGGGTAIGVDLAAKSTPDGYTLVLATTSYGINAAWGKKLPYDSHKDLAFITQTAFQSYAVVVHPSLPVRSVQELIALAKSRPGALNFGTPGPGSGTHLCAELFMLMTGTKMVHIPYKGSAPALTELIGGQTHLMFATILAVAPHIKAGRVRAIATTGARRSALLKDLPTVADAGVAGYEATSWTGVMAPAAIAPEIRDKIHRDVVKTLSLPEVRQRLEADGGEPVGSTPAEFTALVRSEIVKWGKVIKAAGLPPE